MNNNYRIVFVNYYIRKKVVTQNTLCDTDVN